MPISSLAMIALSVGGNVLNNIAGSRTNARIQQLNREAQEAASRNQRELALRLMHESQQCSLEIEEEKQKQRIDDIRCQINQQLAIKATQMAIDEWPLRVPPIVMKNQTLGNISNGLSGEHIALHCFVTPSNSEAFNNHILPQLEIELEKHFNKHWSVNGSHPVIFYGEGWKDTSELATSVVIKSLQTNLSSLPTLVIEPYFSKEHGLTFCLSMWGLTGQNDENNAITSQEIIPDPENKRYFQRTYYCDSFTDTKGNVCMDVVNECLEDIIPYLECLIGFIVDDYFWAAFGIAPALPNMIATGSINTDGMRYLVSESKEHYLGLMTKYDERYLYRPVSDSFSKDIIYALYEGAKVLWRTEDDNKMKRIIANHIEKLSSEDGNVEFIELEQISLNDVIQHILSRKQDYILPCAFVFSLWNDSILYGTMVNEDQNITPCYDYCYRFLVFYNRERYNIEETLEGKYYNFDINNKTITEMNSKTNNPASAFRQRFGETLVKHGESLLRERPSVSPVSSVWGGVNKSTSTEDKVAELTNYFVNSINNNLIEAEASSALSIENFLNWLKSLNLSKVDASKMFILKSFVKTYNRYMYCAFLGNDNEYFIDNKSLTKCFILEKDTQDMKDIFGNSLLYVVPFEK